MVGRKKKNPYAIIAAPLNLFFAPQKSSAKERLKALFNSARGQRLGGIETQHCDAP